MLQMLGAFSELERSLIRERQREGIETAKRKGKRFGRKSSLNKEKIDKVKYMVNAGISKSKIASEFSVSRQSIYNVI